MIALTIHHNAQILSSEAVPGERLLDALTRSGVTVSAPCGGRCFCGKRAGVARLTGEYQADDRAGVARLSWRVSGR